MAPVSVLPGRLRFESKCLIGNKDGCLLIEEMLSARGVEEASASPRTGRVLIRFDEKVLTRFEIEEDVAKALQAAAACTKTVAANPLGRRSVSPRETSSSAVSLVMDMALHAILPAPLDFLLPIAANAFRR